MKKIDKISERNIKSYGKLYEKNESFLRYPADWIIRFHNMYLKKNLPTGRVLDYGCGAGNNSIFFMENGYDVRGVEVNEVALKLIKKNLESHHLDPKLINNFSIISSDDIKLPFKDDYFDLIISNQVFYYFSSMEKIKKACKELFRCLRPGGIVFFTMMGPKNHYIKDYVKQVHPGGLYEVAIDDPRHRLCGDGAFIYLVQDKKHLKNLFSEFKCLSIGFFNESMLDMKSNFHWIFIGQK